MPKHLLIITKTLILTLLIMFQAHAQTPENTILAPNPQTILTGIQAELKQLKISVSRAEESIADLDISKTNLEEINKKLIGILPTLESNLAASENKLKELKPTTEKDNFTETPELQKQRDILKKETGEADSALKLANLLSLEINKLNEFITTQKRKIFTQTILSKSDHIASPTLWYQAFSEIPETTSSLKLLIGDWLISTLNNIQKSTGLIGLFLTLCAAVFTALVHKFSIYRQQHFLSSETPNKFLLLFHLILRKIILWPACILGAKYILETTNWFPGRSIAIFEIFAYALLIYKIWHGISYLITQKNISLFEMTDEWKLNFKRIFSQLALISIAVLVVPTFINDIGAELNLSALISAFINIFASISFLKIAKKCLALQQSDKCLGPQILTQNHKNLKIASYIISLLSMGVLITSSLGYIVLGSFLLKQILWVIFLTSFIYIIYAIINFNQNSEKTSTTKIISITAIKASFLGIAMLAITAPWGLHSGDITSWIYKIASGIQIGSLRISFIDIFISIGLFSLILYLSKLTKNWLEKTLLPTTHLDQGLRASLVSVTGYIGFILAIAISASVIGIGLDNIAIVAGALSVGIGFGLQSIVNNFVSGLILLWERPIRIGDWIEVGTDQGYVRRINVRATEIETPEQASIIVPNSELISGKLKNWMYSDERARISLKFGVSYNSDPKRIKEIVFEEIAKNQDILPTPEPVLFFSAFGASSLDFDLRANIKHINRKLTALSDMHYALFERFKNEGIEIPFPQNDIYIKNLDQLLPKLAQNSNKPKGQKT